MSSRGGLFPASVGLVLGALLALVTAVSPAAAQGQTAMPNVEFLPDTFVILKVGERQVTVREYLHDWFNTWPEDRPKIDSTGRVQFLNTLTNRQLMAVMAKRANPTLSFEQRNTLRAYRNHLLSYVLRLRLVDDSVWVTPEEVKKIRDAARNEYRFQYVIFAEHDMAASARRDLIAKKPLDQVRRSYVTVAQDWDENKWVSTHTLHPQHTAQLALLEVGETSPPFATIGGVALVRMLGRRPAKQIASNSQVVQNYLYSMRTEDRTEQVMTQLREHEGVVYEMANVRWLSEQFQRSGRPRIPVADTGRVLAKGPNLRFSVRSFTNDYFHRAAILRPDVSTPDMLRRAVDDLILESAKVALAEARGLDKDPVYLQLMEQRREGMLIDAFYRDSIAAKVLTKPADRRKYYEKNTAKYLTYATAHFVVLRGPTITEASLLAQRIRAGEKAEDILNEVTAGGKRIGRVGELKENEEDPYRPVLFEELKPGELKLFGPDENGEFFVLQLTAFDPGRQLSYEEAEAYVDETLRVQQADQVLERYLEREKKGVVIVSRADLVMRIHLKDPTF